MITSLPFPAATAHWTFDDPSYLGLNSSESEEKQLHPMKFPVDSKGKQSVSHKDDIPFTQKKGRGHSLRLNGVNEYGIVERLTDSDHIFHPQTKSYTVSLWFKIAREGNGAPKESVLISTGSYCSSIKGWALRIQKVNRIWALVWSINAYDEERTRAGAWLPLNKDSWFGWHHVAAMINRHEASNRLCIYLDGAPSWKSRELGEELHVVKSINWAEIDTLPVCDMDITSQGMGSNLEDYEESIEFEDEVPLILGASRSKHGNMYFHFNGWIDDVRLYKDYALNPEQVGRLASEDFLRFDDKTNERLQNSDVRKVLSVHPVDVPSEKNENDRHFGWPIAAKVDKLVVVNTRRATNHGNPGLNESNGIVIESVNGGDTWGDPDDLLKHEDFLRYKPKASFTGEPDEELVGGDSEVELPLPGDDAFFAGNVETSSVSSMNTIGSLNGRIFLFCGKRGLFIREKDGNWEYKGGVYTKNKVTVYPKGNKAQAAPVGPSIVSVNVPGNDKVEALCVLHQCKTTTDDGILFLMGVSKDEGSTWEQRQWKIPDTRFLPMEPAAIVYDNRIIMLCRNGYNPKGNATWASSLFVLAATEEGVPTEGHFPFHPKRTNIGVPSRSGVRSATLFHDTNSIIYNPKTEEIEALVTNRVTNFPSQPECHSDNIISTGHVIQAMTVSIWSIKPSDLFDGLVDPKSDCVNWTFRGELLSRRSRFGIGGPGGYDGMHLGASVVMEDEETERAFFYCGYKASPNAGAAVMQLVRSLDTSRLSNQLD